MKYMILVQSNPNFQQRWEALPDAERESFGRRHLALDRELAESSELILSEALADQSANAYNQFRLPAFRAMVAQEMQAAAR